jgi:hypothetical protein
MSFPTSPTNNQIATVNGIRYSYSSATRSWTRISNAKYTASASGPTNPANGDHWYDTNNDILFEYIDDGTSQYWVDIQSLGQTGNILSIASSTLQGNIVVGINNLYSIGASNGYLRNIFANTVVGNALTVSSGNIVAAAATTSTSTTTGALVALGGAGIAGNLYVGGSIFATGNATIASNLTVIQSGLFQGPYNENSLLSGVFVGNTGTAPGVTPRVGFFNGNTQQNWQIDNNSGEFRWFVPGTTRLSLYPNGNLNVTGSLTLSGKQAVNGPAFSAYADATAQTITTGSQQKVLFQTEEFDTDNCYANSRFTPTVEGYYQLNAEVRLDGATGTGEMMIVIWKNGAEHKRGTNQQGTQTAANFWAMQVSSVVYANGTTDFFEIYVQQGSGSSVSVTAVNSPNITWFNGCMLRGA